MIIFVMLFNHKITDAIYIKALSSSSPESSMDDARCVLVPTVYANIGSVLYHSCTSAGITIWFHSLLRS